MKILNIVNETRVSQVFGKNCNTFIQESLQL